jgi:hypothetical protein
MRTYKALVTYKQDGQTVLREDVSVIYTRGEPHPKDRIIAIELPEVDGMGRAVYLSLKMIEDATGLKFRSRK